MLCDPPRSKRTMVEEMSEIERAPHYVLVEIFSYLPLEDILKLSSISERFKSVYLSPSLWKNRTFYIDESLDDDAIMNIMEETPSLMHIVMKRTLRDNIQQTICSFCKQIKSLTIDDQKINVDYLRKIIGNCVNLENLSLHHTNFKDVKRVEVIAQCLSLRRLTSSIAKPNHYRKPTLLHPLANGCPRLEHLDMNYSWVSYSEMRTFLEAKKRTLLSLSARWTLQDGHCLVPLLKNCKGKLQSLCLWNFDFPYEDAEDHFTGLRALKTLQNLSIQSLFGAQTSMLENLFLSRELMLLRTLDLSFSWSLDDAAIWSVCFGLPHLESLFLVNCVLLTDNALVHLSLLRSLSTLDISGCTGLGVDALDHVATVTSLTTLCAREMDFQQLRASSLIRMTALRTLDLAASNVTSVPFNIMQENLRFLRSVNVSDCTSEDYEQLSSLKDIMPHVVIHYLHWNVNLT